MEGHPVHPVAAGHAVTAAAQASAPAAPAPTAGLLSTGLRRGLLVSAGIGAVLTALGFAIDAPRAAAGLLVAAQYLLGIGLGGLMFVGFGYVLQAGWHVAIRRVPEAFAGILPIASVGVLLTLACMGLLYHWTHASYVEGDPIMEGKAGWLNTGGFVLRSLVYLAAWLAFAFWMRRHSLQQDLDDDLAHTHRNTTLSAILMVVFGITFTLASIDWLMSMEPHWYSTVFAIYNFSGLFTSALAAMLIVLVALRRMGRLPQLRDDHLHDLGKLTISFATFWGYIWFCQYMLIWYSHIPEETAWYAHRQTGAWSVLHLANPIVNWLIPFLVLLPRPAKRHATTLVRVAVLLLFGRWLDLYYMVHPVVLPDGPAFGLYELAPMALAVGVGILAIFRVLGRHPLVPKNDPYLVESLHHHT